MIELIPEWSKHFDKFWDSIKKRNLLFIKLRYLAVAALVLFGLLAPEILEIKIQPVQQKVILFSALFLLLYNVVIHLIRKNIKPKSGGFNPLHLSLLQMSVDLLLLTLIVYYTGGLESPFLPFYIFHMIIGSLILPGIIVYLSAFTVTLLISVMAALEYHNVLTHYCIYGFLNVEFYDRLPFVYLTLLTFIITLFFSVFLANKIARQLYLQEGHLMNALDELKSSNEKKQKYIMGVMHEIKSPVSASQSLIELILKGYLGEVPENIRGKLSRVSMRNKEAIEMINDVLRISRVHLLGESELEEVNPVALLDEEKEKILEIAKRKNIRIVIKPPVGNPKGLMCDRRILRLAISNVFGNAVKYTQEGGLIEAAVYFPKNFAEIKICDNGKGIPPEEQEKVFVPFYRLKRDKGKTEGTGLGLALVKEIINQHKGEILIKSPSHLGNAENPGTCFLIRLPYNPLEEGVEEIKIKNSGKI